MGLWLKILNRCEAACWRWRRWRNRLFFDLFQSARHRSVEIADDVTLNVPLRGGQGTLRIGKGVVLGYPLAHRHGSGEIMLQPRQLDAVIQIGAGTIINNNSGIVAMKSITIGERCLIGDSCAIYDCDFHHPSPEKRHDDPGEIKPVVIGKNVSIGSRVVILKGVTIGDNAGIGAMSVVTRDVPANCIAAGVPAKVIKKLE